MYTWLYKKLPHCFTEWLCQSHCHQICTSDPHFLDSSGFFTAAILIEVSWYLIMVLVCILLMVNDVEHTYASVYYLYLRLLKCLFNSLVHFLIGLFVSLLLSLKSSLYILDTSPLSDMRLANYRLPHPIFLACLFILSLLLSC